MQNNKDPLFFKIPDYIVEYKTVKGKKWSKVVTVSGSVHEYCIENIREKDELLFRVSAENAIGISLPAESESVKLSKHASKYYYHCAYSDQFYNMLLTRSLLFL